MKKLEMLKTIDSFFCKLILFFLLQVVVKGCCCFKLEKETCCLRYISWCFLRFQQMNESAFGVLTRDYTMYQQ